MTSLPKTYWYFLVLTSLALSRYYVQADSWLVNINTPANESSAIVASTFDAAGNIIAIGNYIDEDIKVVLPTSRTITLPAVSNWNSFILKLSVTSDLMWYIVLSAKRPNSFVALASVAASDDGSIFVASRMCFGSFDISVPKNPTDTQATRTLPSASSFLMRLQSTGDLQWSLLFQQVRFSIRFNGIAINSQSSSVYFLASNLYPNTSITLPPNPSNTSSIHYSLSSGYALLLCKYSFDGEFQWIAPSHGYSNIPYMAGLTIDPSENIFIAIYGEAPLTFQSAGNQPNQRYFASDTTFLRGFFLIKYNPYGIVQWGLCTRSTWAVYPRSIAADSAGNIVLTGMLAIKCNFFGVDDHSWYNFTSYTPSAFTVKYNASGAPVWVSFPSGISSGFGASIDSNDNILVSGTFSSKSLGFSSIASDASKQLTGPSTPGNIWYDLDYLFFATYTPNGTIENVGRVFSIDPSLFFDSHAETFMGSSLIVSNYKASTILFERDDVMEKYSLNPPYQTGGFLWYRSNATMSLLDAFSKSPAICSFTAGAGRLLIFSTIPSMKNRNLLEIESKSRIKMACSYLACVVSVNDWFKTSFTKTVLHSINVYYVSTDTGDRLLDLTCTEFNAYFGPLLRQGSVENGDFSFQMEPQYGMRHFLSMKSVTVDTFMLLGFEITSMTSLIIGFSGSKNSTVSFHFTPHKLKYRLEPGLLESDTNLSITDHALLRTRWSFVLENGEILLYNDEVNVFRLEFPDQRISAVFVSSWDGSVSMHKMLLTTPPSNYTHLLTKISLDDDNANTSTMTDQDRSSSVDSGQTTSTSFSATNTSDVEPYQFVGSISFYVTIGLGSGLFLIISIASIVWRRLERFSKAAHDVTASSYMMTTNFTGMSTSALKHFQENHL